MERCHVIPQRPELSEGYLTVLARERIGIVAVAAWFFDRGNHRFCPSFQFIEICQGFAWSVVPQRVSFLGKEQVGGFISVVASRGGRTIARPPKDKRLVIVVAPTAPIGEAPAALVPPQTVVRLAAAATAVTVDGSGGNQQQTTADGGGGNRQIERWRRTMAANDDSGGGER
jgi:hypothetical protein